MKRERGLTIRDDPRCAEGVCEGDVWPAQASVQDANCRCCDVSGRKESWFEYCLYSREVTGHVVPRITGAPDGCYHQPVSADNPPADNASTSAGDPEFHRPINKHTIIVHHIYMAKDSEHEKIIMCRPTSQRDRRTFPKPSAHQLLPFVVNPSVLSSYFGHS